MLLLNLQLALFRTEPGFVRLRDAVKSLTLISVLEDVRKRATA